MAGRKLFQSTDPDTGNYFKQEIAKEDLPDVNYTHVQMMPAATWVVTHNLGRRPNVTVVDQNEFEVIADIQYIDDNSININFQYMMSGKAYLN